jgi:hypothetical protein
MANVEKIQRGRLRLLITIIGRDKNGKITHRKTIEAHSYVLAMIDGLYVCMAQATQYMNNTAGSSKGVVAGNYQQFPANAGSGDNTFGIVVGTGTAAVTISDYHLQTIIANGTGSGQLQYGSVSFASPSTTGTTRQFTISRTFTNGSGASITVNEVALYVKFEVSGPTVDYFCVERSLLTFTITSGSSETVIYTIKATV